MFSLSHSETLGKPRGSWSSGGTLAGNGLSFYAQDRYRVVQMATTGDDTAAWLITLNSKDSVNVLLDKATRFYDMGDFFALAA